MHIPAYVMGLGESMQFADGAARRCEGPLRAVRYFPRAHAVEL